MPWWQDYNAHKYFQFRNYQLEARYYPRGAVNASKSNNRVSEANLEAHEHNKKAFTGFYLQAYTHLFGQYNFLHPMKNRLIVAAITTVLSLSTAYRQSESSRLDRVRVKLCAAITCCCSSSSTEIKLPGMLSA